MGLASYGQPEYRDRFDEIVKINGNVGFSLGLDHFIHHKIGPEMTWRDGEPKIGKLYGDFLTRRLGPERRRARLSKSVIRISPRRCRPGSKMPCSPCSTDFTNSTA